MGDLFLKSIHQVYEIDWSRTYHWDIKFEKGANAEVPPHPFDDWFPAINVEVTSFNLSSFTYNSPVMTHMIPQSCTTVDVNVTFLDSDRLSLYYWLKRWVDRDILHLAEDNPYLGYVSQIVRPLHIIKFCWRPSGKNGKYTKDVVDDSVYSVFPDGSLVDPLTSESSSKTYTVMFRVTGIDNLANNSLTNP